MTEKSQRSISELMADTSLIEAAIRRAVREAVLNHARLGHAVPVWEGGKVVWACPADILAQSAKGKRS